jgi:hypothetical protein
MRLKIVLTSLACAVALAVIPAKAQTSTNNVPLPPVATNDISSFIGDLGIWLSQGTNWMVVPYAIITDKDSGLGDGAGVSIAYRISDYVVSGMRVDWLKGAFYQGSFTSQLQLPLDLFNHKLTIVPFALGGVAVPFGGGSGDTSGSVQGIAGTGMALRLGFLGAWAGQHLDLVGDIEKWSALPGRQYRFGIVYKF